MVQDIAKSHFKNRNFDRFAKNLSKETDQLKSGFDRGSLSKREMNIRLRGKEIYRELSQLLQCWTSSFKS